MNASLKLTLGFTAFLTCSVIVPQLDAADGAAKHRYCSANDPHVKVTATLIGIHRIDAGTGSAAFEARISLRIVNLSEVSVLLLANQPRSDHPLVGDVFLSTSGEKAQACHYTFSETEWPARDTSMQWQKLRFDLDKEAPPTELIRTIAPGAFWEFEADRKFSIAQRGAIDKSYPPFEEIRRQPSLFLQFRLLMWPNNLEKDMLNPIFGTGLREKWKGNGHLVIDNLVSDPISIQLPDK
jgi:hypothetical protein